MELADLGPDMEFADLGPTKPLATRRYNVARHIVGIIQPYTPIQHVKPAELKYTDHDDFQSELA
jgi:hypothetical protein